MNKQELYHVTSNPGKFGEVSTYIQSHAPHITLKQFDADIEEIQSTDAMAIAVDKAKKAWAKLQKPLILDDAGVYFNKYNNFPGTLSKYVSQGIGFEGIKRLIDNGDRAMFLLYVVYIDAPDSIHIFEGKTEGHLIKPENFQGNTHLPYDVYFVPDGSTQSYAQLRQNFTENAHYFYRVRGITKFLEWYNKR